MILHHVSVGVKDVEAAGRFYDSVLGELGYRRVMDYAPGAIAYGAESDIPEFWIGLPYDQQAANTGNGTHIAFNAASIAAVHAFHKAALRLGGSDEGEPGPRPDYGRTYYGAFVRDPDGNKIEAVLHASPHVAKLKLPAAAKPKPRKTKKTKAKPAKKAPAKKAKKPVKKTSKAPAKKAAKKKARKR